MAISQKPYPPIVDTWNPTVIKGEGVKIYFSLSAYNSIKDIRRDLLLVEIMDVETNNSAVNVLGNNGYYQLISNISVDEDNNYYTILQNNRLNLEKEKTYKIQLRFCSSACQVSSAMVQTNPANYRDYISDYSSATLIKVISRPKLKLSTFPIVDANSEYVVSTASFAISGKVLFMPEAQTESEDVVEKTEECLTSYSIVLYENEAVKATSNDTIFYDSGTLYPDTKNLNSFYKVIKKDLKNGVHYLLNFSYTTSSGYTATEEYAFRVLYEAEIDYPPPYIFTKLDKEDGSILVTITANTEKAYQGYFILRRSSSLDNFETWEDLKFYKYETPKIIQEHLKDYLVQAGVIYRYQVIPMNSAGYRGIWDAITANPLEPDPAQQYM